MSSLEVTIWHALQESQDSEHAIYELTFRVGPDGMDYTARVKQMVGGDFHCDPLEVGAAQGYKGPWNHLEFRKKAEAYCRQWVGVAGKAIQYSGSAPIMSNNIFGQASVFTLNVSGPDAAW